MQKDDREMRALAKNLLDDYVILDHEFERSHLHFEIEKITLEKRMESLKIEREEKYCSFIDRQNAILRRIAKAFKAANIFSGENEWIQDLLDEYRTLSDDYEDIISANERPFSDGITQQLARIHKRQAEICDKVYRGLLQEKATNDQWDEESIRQLLHEKEEASGSGTRTDA